MSAQHSSVCSYLQKLPPIRHVPPAHARPLLHKINSQRTPYACIPHSEKQPNGAKWCRHLLIYQVTYPYFPQQHKARLPFCSKHRYVELCLWLLQKYSSKFVSSIRRKNCCSRAVLHQQAQIQSGARAEGWETLGYRDTHVFHLHVRLQTILSQLSPIPRCFVATKWGLCTKHIVTVYPETETKS